LYLLGSFRGILIYHLFFNYVFLRLGLGHYEIFHLGLFFIVIWICIVRIIERSMNSFGGRSINILIFSARVVSLLNLAFIRNFSKCELRQVDVQRTSWIPWWGLLIPVPRKLLPTALCAPFRLTSGSVVEVTNHLPVSRRNG